MAKEEILNINLSQKFLKELKKKSSGFGFQNVNEVINFLLYNFVQGKLMINFNNKFNIFDSSSKVSKELEQEILKSLEDFHKGKVSRISKNDPKGVKNYLKRIISN